MIKLLMKEKLSICQDMSVVVTRKPVCSEKFVEIYKPRALARKSRGSTGTTREILEMKP